MSKEEKQLEADIRRVEVKYVQMDNPRTFPFRPRIIGIDPIRNAYNIKAGIIKEVR